MTQRNTQSVRLTVRLPSDLYDRLTIFAKGRNHGATPELSAIVREALEQYIAPVKRQTPKENLSDTRMKQRDTIGC